MIKVIHSEDSTLTPGSFGYVRNMRLYKVLRFLVKLILFLSIFGIPILLIWFFYEYKTKPYKTGAYLVFGKKRYSLSNDREIAVTELNKENGDTLLGAVAGGVLFGGVGALLGAGMGSQKTAHFLIVDRLEKKTIIEIRGTPTVKKFQSFSMIDKFIFNK